MNKAKKTYLSWEMKKLIPLFVVSALYVIVIFASAYISLEDYQSQVLLSFGSTDYSCFLLGDVFMHSVQDYMEDIHGFAVIVFSTMLIILNFRFEHRTGISDFLRVLPISEAEKTRIKLLAGESIILFVSLFFGLCGSFVNSILAPGINQVNSMYLPGGSTTNTYMILWMTALVMFLSLSGIYLVLFAVQSMVHNMPIAFALGTGVLCIPRFLTVIYQFIITSSHTFSTDKIFYIYPLPNIIECSSDSQYQSIAYESVVWKGYNQFVVLCVATIVIALLAIGLSIAKRWNIRESSNNIVNVDGILRFFMIGLSVCAGISITFITNRSYYYDSYAVYRFVALSLIASAVVYFALYALTKILYRIKRES